MWSLSIGCPASLLLLAPAPVSSFLDELLANVTPYQFVADRCIVLGVTLGKFGEEE
jgi:hypothetical protein